MARECEDDNSRFSSSKLAIHGSTNRPSKLLVQVTKEDRGSGAERHPTDCEKHKFLSGGDRC